MAVASPVRIEERDARVAEWLDDKLQTLADLESLDALLQVCPFVSAQPKTTLML
jgi:hypothetical protein